MGGEPDAYGESKDGLKRKIGDSIELAKQKAQELAVRLNIDAETKRARVEPPYSSPVPPAGAFSQPSFYGNSQNYQSQPTSYSSYGSAPTSRKISIPNDKVGVVIGRGGDTIKSLQLQSGARIQIAKDSQAANMATRDVDLVGTADQVSRAEELINSVLAEVDAGGSSSGAAYGARSDQTGGEQIVMKVPDNRVALLIGKGGETIKTIQSRSGARLQIVPLRPPPNEILTERSVFINGSQEQIDSAQEMVNEIVREGRLRVPPTPSGYMQPAYTPPASWVPPGQAQSGYEYPVPGAYPPAASYYGEYGSNPQAGWDQSNPTPVLPPQQSTGYTYYGQTDQTGSAPQAYYGYGQTPAPISSQGGYQGYPPQPGQPSTVNQQNAYPNYGSVAAQPTSAPPLNPISTSQVTTTQVSYGNPQGYTAPQPAYGTSQGYTVPPTSQPAYGTSYPVTSQPAYGAQQGYSASLGSQSAYGAQQGYSVPTTSQTAYGLQQGYTVPPTYNQAGYGGQQHYGQNAYPTQPAPPSAAYEQSYPTQPQPAQAHASKTITDGTASQGQDSSPAVQTTSHSSSRSSIALILPSS